MQSNSGMGFSSQILRSRARTVRTQRLQPCGANVSFRIEKSVSWGDKLCLVGNHKLLGRWKTHKGAELRWSDGDVWTAEIEFPDETQVEFKVVNVKGQGDPDWESGDNRQLALGSAPVAVSMKWGRTDNGSVAPVAESISSDDGNALKSIDLYQTSFDEGPNPSELDRLTQNEWQGKDIQFMTENRHSKERSGVWNTEGLDGALLDLVQGDEKSASWLQKLDMVKDILVEKSEHMKPGLDALASCYIYLQWIMTGSVVCVEGGGHYRPNRHAELAKVMFRSLEWVVGDNSRSDAERLIARRLQAKLPSFSESFTSSVPLTRIRDIAHRNDIPHDLKREIKHTLQNKLHRNAGPEDLVATEAMLGRITAPGTDYSPAFVHEFRVFTEELRDFFNAGSLVSILEAVKGSMDEGAQAAVGQFLETKGRMEREGGEDLVVECMHQLTSVRSQLVAGLASGLRNDAPDAAMAMRQRWRLAELRCEDYAFILISRYINELEGSGVAARLQSGQHDAWARPLGALVLATRHCGLSGWQPAECLAIDDDLGCWQKLGAATTEDDILRLKASLERVQRLTDSFADTQLQVFADRAQRLGAGLGLPGHVQNVFTEAEIRANVAFQLSKLNTALLHECRERLGMGAYDGIVFGEAAGELVEVERIEPGAELAGGEDCVLLVQSATGDEEVSTAGDNIKGVILCQELPHLSHLGVRSRQENVPLATCTSQAEITNTIKPLLGSHVKLTITTENVSIVAHTPSKPASKGPPPPKPAASSSPPSTTPAPTQSSTPPREPTEPTASSSAPAAAPTAEPSTSDPQEPATASADPAATPTAQPSTEEASIPTTSSSDPAPAPATKPSSPDPVDSTTSPATTTVSPTAQPPTEESVDPPQSSSAAAATPTAEPAATDYTPASAVTKSSTLEAIPLSAATLSNAGAKAAVCAELARLPKGPFDAPAGAVLPFGCMELSVAAAGVSDDFSALLETLEGAEVGSDLDKACAQIQDLLLKRCQPPEEVVTAAAEGVATGGIMIARSSANVEDLEGLSGAGLYESVPNLKAGDAAELARGVAEVWASLYSRRAVLSRRSAGIAQKDACMAVLLQEMIAPDLSFVLHTRDPMQEGTTENGTTETVYAELAPGLGETLASGTQGSAWRLSIGATPDTLKMRAYANFSAAYVPVGAPKPPAAPGSSIYGSRDGGGETKGMVSQRVVSYSRHELSTNEEKRKEVAGKLYKVGKFLEEQLDGPQDVEGAIVGDSVYVVQSRPQP